jgi:putative transposase
LSIRAACASFAICTACYRSIHKLDAENAKIAESLIQLIETNRSRGFGLCFLHLLNVKKKRWNHKQVYRIYCDLKLNLRIKPKKRLERETPVLLAVPVAKNEIWSMDFMLDQ